MSKKFWTLKPAVYMLNENMASDPNKICIFFFFLMNFLSYIGLIFPQ